MTAGQVTALVRPLSVAIRWQPAVASWAMIAVLLAIEDEARDAQSSALMLLRAVGVVAVLGAAFVLDDEAATTLEASPSTLAWRRFLRGSASVALVTPPWVAAVWRLDTHATRLPVAGLTLELYALLALALATAAAVTRWSGSTDPGMAATPVVLMVVLGAFQLPARFALYGVPGSGWDAAHARWVGVFAAATLVLLWCGRDPEARRLIKG
jgi:hypothetical protein